MAIIGRVILQEGAWCSSVLRYMHTARRNPVTQSMCFCEECSHTCVGVHVHTVTAYALPHHVPCHMCHNPPARHSECWNTLQINLLSVLQVIIKGGAWWHAHTCWDITMRYMYHNARRLHQKAVPDVAQIRLYLGPTQMCLSNQRVCTL